MTTALALARRGLGRVWPNPAVGCVLVRGGRVVGRGWTQPGGRPHAETEALARAGEAARGAVAYVSLEPCSHHGETAPCADAMIDAGVGRVVVACEDPDARVSGRGVARLRDAGIDVATGVAAAEAEALNAGFFMRVRHGRPLFTLKVAATLDGRIAAASGESRWITGEAARAAGHRLRAEHDAVVVGSATARADDPQLTCRLPGLEDRSPLRIVLDGRLRTPPDLALVREASAVATWIVTVPGADPGRRAALEARGVEIVEAEADAAGHPDPAAVADALGRRGLTRVLIEGGGAVAASYLANGLVDRLAWFQAPRLIGGDGVPGVAGLGVERIADAPGFRLTRAERVGEDLLAEFEL